MQSEMKDFLKKFEGKQCFILTNFQVRYLAHNLKVFENHVSFTDKFGTEVMLSISEITQIMGVRE